MWIIPSNFHHCSVSDLEFLDLSAGLNAQLEKQDLLLMSKSKPLSWQTLLRACRRVSWMRYLVGSMLRPSSRSQNTFAKRYAESLPDTAASLFLLPEKEKAPKIQDTFGRLYHELSKQQDLFGAY